LGGSAGPRSAAGGSGFGWRTTTAGADHHRLGKQQKGRGRNSNLKKVCKKACTQKTGWLGMSGDGWCLSRCACPGGTARGRCRFGRRAAAAKANLHRCDWKNQPEKKNENVGEIAPERNGGVRTLNKGGASVGVQVSGVQMGAGVTLARVQDKIAGSIKWIKGKKN